MSTRTDTPSGKAAWHRASKTHPCPVCGRVGSCVFTGRPGTPDAALCVHVPSEAICGRGYLHRLDERAPAWPAWTATLYQAKAMIETTKRQSSKESE